jgi:hypothetical protein
MSEKHKSIIGGIAMFQKATLATSLLLVGGLALGGTPTIDGTFDGVSVWGDAVTTNSNPGFSDAGATATALYVTDDSSYVYLGAAVTGLGSWMSFGFVVDAKTGGSNSQDTWGRQIDYAFPSVGDFDAPELDIRGNCNNGWAERHVWDGSQWTGFGTDITTSEYNCSPTNGWIECRIPKSVLNMRATKEIRVEFFLTGDSNAHGLFTSVPYDTPCDTWSPSSHQTLTNPVSGVTVPVAVSAFSLE